MRNKIWGFVVVTMLLPVGICGCQKAPERSINGDILHAKDSVEDEVDAIVNESESETGKISDFCFMDSPCNDFISIISFVGNPKDKKMIPAVILLLEGLTFLSGFYFRKNAKFLFGVWGMYAQSNLCEGIYGFSIISIIVVQVTIIIVCYWLGGHLLKGKKMEGV